MQHTQHRTNLTNYLHFLKFPSAFDTAHWHSYNGHTTLQYYKMWNQQVHVTVMVSNSHMYNKYYAILMSYYEFVFLSTFASKSLIFPPTEKQDFAAH
jgi:hypothetical protein